MPTRAELLRAFRHQSWREGWAHEWLLDDGQQAWRGAFWGTAPLSSTVWNIGRQRGKTFSAVFLALEHGIAEPGAVIRYCAKTKDSAIGIVKPAWDTITSTMPDDLRPVPGRNETEWVFPSTGAVFVLFGTDAQSFAKGRGPKTTLQLFDEAGFYQDLEQVEAALLPSLQTTGGRALYLSTPAESTAHPYTQRIHAARAAGRYQHDTFWSNPRVNHEGVIAAECTRLGLTREQLLESTYFRREYLAEVVTDESRAAMPAWTVERARVLTGDWERPAHWDGYQAHDPGIESDPHASLFGWHDPATNSLVIEDELELRSAAHTIRQWSDEVKKKERALYGVDRWEGTIAGAKEWAANQSDVPEWLRDILRRSAPRQPYLRVADNAQGVCKELSVEHGLTCIPTDKSSKAFHADAVNSLIVQGRLRVHRRCVRLLTQLTSTVWDRTRTTWERTATDHGDLIDCLLYMARNVRWHRDCRPPPAPRDEFAPPAPKSRTLDALRGWK